MVRLASVTPNSSLKWTLLQGLLEPDTGFVNDVEFGCDVHVQLLVEEVMHGQLALRPPPIVVDDHEATGGYLNYNLIV